MKKKTLSALSAVAVITVGAGIMLLLTSFKAEPALLEEPVTSRLVRTEPLESTTQTQWIEADGFLESPRKLSIHTPLAGKVNFAYEGLKGGTPVQKGDLLIQLDDRRARLAFESARADMIHLTTQFITLAGMDSASRSLWENYLTALSAAPAENLPSLPTGDTRQDQLAVTKGVTGAFFRLESASIDLLDHKITALFSGVLSGDGISEGAWVSPGAPLAELWEVNPLELALTVAVSDMNQIETGTEVLVTGPDGQVILGQVVRKEPYLQTRSQSAKVYVSLEFPDGEEWPAGAFVEARLRGQEWEMAYQIPREALVNGKLPLYKEDRLVLEEITILGTVGNQVIFQSPLNKGAEYVTTVLQNPMEGMLLKKGDK
jgi:membrane fusion protein (multidrug efflux system)